MKRVNAAPDDPDSFDEFGPNHEKHRIAQFWISNCLVEPELFRILDPVNYPAILPHAGQCTGFTVSPVEPMYRIQSSLALIASDNCFLP